jgi:hypothetical protein
MIQIIESVRDNQDSCRPHLASHSLLQSVLSGRQAKTTLLNPMALFIDVLLIRLPFNWWRPFLILMVRSAYSYPP